MTSRGGAMAAAAHTRSPARLAASPQRAQSAALRGAPGASAASLASQALGQGHRLAAWGFGQDDGKFLAAEPSGDIVLAHGFANNAPDAREHDIAGQVPIGIVDIAQEVEIGHKNGQRALEACGALKL